jgi:uncharacterized protein YecE (DUF72 family)
MDAQEAMQVLIGTSGYSYSWNEGRPTPFRWYLERGFNSVEINASFYRFPSRSWARAWLQAPEGFLFSIKAHRLITHGARLGPKAGELFRRFREPLRELEPRIAFWLFQMPSGFAYGEDEVERIARFIGAQGLEGKAVLEFRHASWWGHVGEVERAGAIFCSVDAPGLPGDVLCTHGTVYMRLHGRQYWYSYEYSEEELEEIWARIIALKPRRAAIYLNNDHGMLPNGLYLMKRAGLR